MMKTIECLSAELKDSFFMAMGAVVAHKLRSALTLLGVLVGVFSIIVVMTSMRAMQQKIESDLNQLGGQTFVVQRWPPLHFEGRRERAKLPAPQANRLGPRPRSWRAAPPCP